jgi:hypothetical protein
MTSKQILITLAIASIGIFTISSCVKKKFDSPPNSDSPSVNPDIKVNASILQLKKLFTGSASIIDSDYVVSGIVTADDRAGGFYQQIVVQDSTSGIMININQKGIAADFPIGRRVFIKCKGLYLGASYGVIELGSKPSAADPNSANKIVWSEVPTYILKGNTGNSVTPIDVTISQLKGFINTTNATQWMGTLIRIDSAEFINADVNQIFAEDASTATGGGTNRTIKDCANQQIIVRMSSYANYRTALIPSGRGPVTAIYSRYNTTPQLLIRDTTDIPLNGIRCDGTVFQPPVSISIDSVRKMWNGTGKALGNIKIHGVITSKWVDSNIAKFAAYIQDESGRGINLYYGGTPGYNLGETLEIDLTADSLILYGGILELKVKTAKTTKIIPGLSVTPISVSIADLNADLNQVDLSKRIYESRLVKIMNATINGGTSIAFKGSLPINDGGADNITMYTRNQALFGLNMTPTGSVNIIAIASKFNTTNQILLRQASDIQ